MARVQVTHYTDPGCPWAWSASPALAALVWRYGDQLEWRHVMIGLAEDAQRYVDLGYSPLLQARGFRAFRRFGMPFAPEPKAAMSATSPACRAVVAVRLRWPEREWAALRALQFAQFCSAGLLEDPEVIRSALAGVDGVDAAAVVAALEAEDTWAAYEADRAETRTAAGTPAAAQGKTAATDGPERFTAPSLTFTLDGRSLVAGGFQSLMAYDVLLANLDPGLARRDAPEDLGEALAEFPDGLTTAEVAELGATGAAQETDRVAAEEGLLELAAEGAVERIPLGDDALWRLARVAAARLRVADGRSLS